MRHRIRSTLAFKGLKATPNSRDINFLRSYRHTIFEACKISCSLQLNDFYITGSLERGGTAEWRLVTLVLRNLHFLDEFTKRGSVSRSIFSNNSDLSGALGHGFSADSVCKVIEYFINVLYKIIGHFLQH